ncbi:protein FAR1-RELATED SEQUENCE 5 [Lolium perenne]|uniref:protein FAR1-RELATED SEQUENCE 5 n=1 Tax=Lolium perenne TaxID=4522 RepID=UPI003A99F5C2
MDDQTCSVQNSSDMSISSDDDGIEHQKKSSVELEEDQSATQADVLLADPELGMTFDTENDVREYYKNYAKAKGFGVTRRSSNRDANGELKYLTICCSRHGKTESNSRNILKPKPTAGLGCKAKINIVRGPEGNFHISMVILDHNHTLSPHKSRLFRCNKRLDYNVKRRLELNDRAGIRVNKNFNSLVVAADGHENLTFGEKECRNYLDKTRRLKLGSGDAEAVRNYFMKMQSDNPNFFSVMDVDDESRLRNVFWADARSRAVYDSFDDVITFDTTYLVNKYDMPFACFVGVNHHGQSVLLGCALLSNEDTPTFVWLFEAWLACMSNRQPKAIVTDQAKAIQNAVEIVFPDARYRWCLWHIMKKLPEKLGGYDEYEYIKTAIGKVVYDSLTIKDFEDSWMRMLERYNIADNEWLKGLYENRHRWVPAFVKDTFWAGMSTTQRSESMHAFFDGYVNAKTTLKHFTIQYENALRDKVEKEILADFNSFHSTIPCVTHFDIEQQFQSVYTNSKFKEFQQELTNIMYCDRNFIQKEGAVETYKIIEDVLIDKEEGWRKDYVYHVYFNAEEFEVKCSCRHFEFRETGSMSEESCNDLIEQLRNLKIKPSGNSSSENSIEHLGIHEGGAPSIGETSKTILSPIAVRCAGRPPLLRKESKVDKLIREAREKKKKAEQRDKKKAAQREKKKSDQERSAAEDEEVAPQQQKRASSPRRFGMRMRSSPRCLCRGELATPPMTTQSSPIRFR